MASNPVGFGQMFESAEGSSESHDDCIYIFVLDFFCILTLCLSQHKEHKDCISLQLYMQATSGLLISNEQLTLMFTEQKSPS